MNHVNNVNSILAEEFNRPIRGRQWLKLNREDRRSKSEQTHASKQTTQLTKLDRNLKMGQNNSTNALADNDKDFELEMSDFPQNQDSEIIVRERARGSKLEEVYKRKKGRITGETQHTLTMKEDGKSTAQTFSKREIAKPQHLFQQSS